MIDHCTLALCRYSGTAALFRSALRFLSPDDRRRANEAIAYVFQPRQRAVRHRCICPARLSRISAVTSDCHGVCEPDVDVQRDWALLATHDALTGWYRHFWAGRQIGRSMDQLGRAGVDCVDQGYVFAARGCGPE